MCIRCITGPLVTVGDAMTVISTYKHWGAQSSILNSLFFICFMNDFSKSSQLLFSIPFADDTTVLLEGHEYGI